jgi:N-acetyl-alpha-D-muramate 1-phosphate uridylyltransferase
MTDNPSLATIDCTAMVLAAGFGKRMQPLSLQTPKPLLKVGANTMLDAALDRLHEVGVTRAIVNTHYLATQIKDHLATRLHPAVQISYEKEILDTGGGVKNVLSHFGKPFFVLNADLPWQEDGRPALQRLAASFLPDSMDALLLVMPTEKANGFSPDGDFGMNEDGLLVRAHTKPPRPYVFIGAMIVQPACYTVMTAKVFSNNLIWDRAEAAGRLYGCVHTGTCFHVGTPADLEKANALLQNEKGWRR